METFKERYEHAAQWLRREFRNLWLGEKDGTSKKEDLETFVAGAEGLINGLFRCLEDETFRKFKALESRINERLATIQVNLANKLGKIDEKFTLAASTDYVHREITRIEKTIENESEEARSERSELQTVINEISGRLDDHRNEILNVRKMTDRVNNSLLRQIDEWSSTKNGVLRNEERLTRIFAGLRRCQGVCGLYRPLSDFYRHGSEDKRDPVCQECRFIEIVGPNWKVTKIGEQSVTGTVEIETDEFDNAAARPCSICRRKKGILKFFDMLERDNPRDKFGVCPTCFAILEARRAGKTLILQGK